MTDTRPAPLVPAEVDLRGLPFIPLDTVRLLDSDLFALSTGDEFKAAVALWCKSWLQIPAASLPDDDRVLAHLSGAGTRWKKLKPMAMRGWVLCSDGRWYHAVVAEKALEAWEHRADFRESTNNKNERQRRWRERLKQLSTQLRDLGITPPPGASLKELERLLVDAGDRKPSTQASTAASTRDKSETGLTETVTGTSKHKSSNSSGSSEGKGPVDKTAPPENSENSRPGQIVKLLVDQGVAIAESDAVVSEWERAGVTDQQLTQAVSVCREPGRKGDAQIPGNYLARVLEDILNPKPATEAWWKSESATVAEGRRRGVTPRAGESMEAFRDRIRQAKPEQGRAAA